VRPSTEQLLNREKEFFEADPVGLVKSGYLMIRNKDGDLVPLVLNSTQLKIVEAVQDRRRKGRPALIFVIKARQLGVTTLAQALIYAFSSQRPNLNALDVADDVEGASYIFKMNELFQEQMLAKNPHLIPATKRMDEKRLEFTSHSRIMIDTARNARAGRKYTLKLVHLSEVAFYENYRELMQALTPAIPKTEDTIVILESTANGINDVSKFYWKIKAAYEADPESTDWIPMFCSWKEHAEYARAFYNDGLRQKFIASLSEKEKKIMAEHGLSFEQMNWRRREIEDSFGDDDEKFQVEYPLTDKEAFVSTSLRVFPERLTAPQKVNLALPKLRGEIELVDRRPSFVPDAKGFLRIYQEAQPEERYVIGADTCESALTHDEACAQVVKRSTWTQVAHLHGHMNPEDFAERLLSLGLYYNRALLCPERNGPGLVTVTHLANRRYPNLCKQKKAVVSDEGVWSETDEYGFHTNVKTKPLVIDQLQNALRTLLLVLHDALTLEELETYVIKRVNKEGHAEMGSEEGCRDDCVIALAIALHYAHQLPSQTMTLGAAPQYHSHSKTGY
jgi:hypothetical protein